MSKEQFSSVLDAMALIDVREMPWESFSCDADGWEMTHYGPDGAVMQSSGALHDIEEGILRMIALSWPEPEAA